MKHRSTTVLCIRHRGSVAMAGDGQVSVGNTIMKHRARKVRRMHEGKVLGGFAGSAADGLTLFDRFERRLEEHRGRLMRAAVELAREWRTDRMLRRLEAMLLVADRETVLVISGNGDVLEPDHGIAAVGSGGPYALAAAQALMEHTELPAEDIARRALEIASDICVYTNREIVLELL
ncbi:MAG: ATP-dependent protease subunit HslV [Armatimonadetes bacterium]|nr:ATP-dependent protease subunit HslV [Armatimonadota bacterium]